AAEETKNVGQTVGQATENYGKLIDRLNELEKRVTDPAAKAEVKDIGGIVEVSHTELTKADSALKRNLATQQQIVSQNATSLVDDSGWMFIGKVNEDKTAWSASSPQTVSPTPTLPISAGTTLTVRDNAYFRSDAPSNARASAAILGAVKVGETLEVI